MWVLAPEEQPGSAPAKLSTSSTKLVLEIEYKGP